MDSVVIGKRVYWRAWMMQNRLISGTVTKGPFSHESLSAKGYLHTQPGRTYWLVIPDGSEIGLYMDESCLKSTTGES